MKKKAILKIGVILALVLSLFTSSHQAKADEIAKCSITITTENIWPNLAHATGPCKGFVEGWYVPPIAGDSEEFAIGGALSSYKGLVEDGQIIEISLPPTTGYYTAELTVKIVRLNNEQPKPQEPKEPPKDEKPKDEKPKDQQPKPQNPQTPPKSQQPKQEEPKDNKPSSPKTETPKTGNQSGGNTGGQSGSKQNPSEIKPSPSNSGSSGENKDSNPNVVEGNKKLPDSEEVASWTTEEMKEKGAIVEKVDGKYFATIDGVKKEITKQQAQELGFEETDEEDTSEHNEPDKKEDKDTEEKNVIAEKEDKNNVLPIILGIILVAGTTISLFYTFSSKELKNKINDKIKGFFKFGIRDKDNNAN